MFIEMLEGLDKIAIFNDRTIEEKIKIINQFYKEIGSKHRIVKEGGYFIITDRAGCERAGIAEYDEKGRYLNQYSLSDVKQFVFDFVNNMGGGKKRKVFTSIIPDPNAMREQDKAEKAEAEAEDYEDEM